MDTATFTQLAISFLATEQLPYVEKTSLRVNKKIYATPEVSTQKACVKLSTLD